MEENIPEIIGKYKILEELGKGAFGVSYLAEHELLNRKAVIKLARADMSDSVERLMKESRVLGRLIHPNIIQTMDVGITEDNKFYLATEWIDGKDLQSIIKEKGHFNTDLILNIIRDLATAIDYAHTKGIIHRDIKPSNIIITVDGTAKLIDFGLVGILRKNTSLTQPGEIFGTPAYMSPEQIRGEPQSTATDIYSIGIVIYEMAYGRRPFESTNLAGLFGEIIQGKISFPLAPDVPRSLKTLIKKCIHPDPKKRISSGKELLNAIEELVVPNARQAVPLSTASTRPESVLTAPPKKASHHLLIVLMIFITIAFFSFGWLILLPSSGKPISGLRMQPRDMSILIGSIVLISLSIFAGMKLGTYLNRARPEAQRRAESILMGTTDRDSLTKSIAIEIDGLFDNLKTFDERFLAQSIALVMKDYERAKKIDDRQKALMNAVTILEKLTDRLSPWYVRHEKAVAFVVSSVGIISGVATATATLMKIISK